MRIARYIFTLVALAAFYRASAADAAQAAEEISLWHEDPGFKSLAKALETDLRSPSLRRISGVWVQNPKLRGPAHTFQLTQEKNEITGSGFFAGCMGTQSYTITGKRDSDHLALKFLYADGRVEEVALLVSRIDGVVALQWHAGDEFPQIPRVVRDKLRAKVKTEPNPSSETPAPSGHGSS